MSGERSGFAIPPGTLEPIKIDPEAVKFAQSAGASIGKKYLMAIAGLIWCFFVLAHLLGNFTIFGGQEMMNVYSHHLLSLGPILIAMEAGLVFFLLLHVILSIVVTLQNQAARPVKYRVDVPKGGRGVASSSMIWTGAAILGFIVIHLINLKFAHHGRYDGNLDIYTSTIALFAEPLYVVGYVIAVCLVGLHSSHALQSALRTLGWNSDRAGARVDLVSRLFGLFLAFGFSSIPLWIHLTKVGQS